MAKSNFRIKQMTSQFKTRLNYSMIAAVV